MKNAGHVLILKCLLGFFLIACIGIMGISCRSTKKITKAISKKDTVQIKTDTPAVEDLRTDSLLHLDSLLYIRQLYSHIESNIIDCRTFSAKLKVHYEGSDGKDYTFSAL